MHYYPCHMHPYYAEREHSCPTAETVWKRILTLRLYPDLEPEQVARYYKEHSNSFGFSKCMSPWVMAEVMPNGDVVTCRDYPDFVVGYIKEKNLLDIWNDNKMRSFRSLLKQEGGLLPVCTRCQGLMGW